MEIMNENSDTVYPALPIIMSVDSGRAIRDGIKTETRRAITLPRWSTGKWEDFEATNSQAFVAVHGSREQNKNGVATMREIKSPYGVTGDYLWVRECYGFTPDKRLARESDSGVTRETVDFWRPAYLMPRRLSNLTLKISFMEVTRLSEITEVQALAEGCPEDFQGAPITWYSSRWDALNAKRGHPWDRDAWVWRVVFLDASEEAGTDG